MKDQNSRGVPTNPFHDNRAKETNLCYSPSLPPPSFAFRGRYSKLREDVDRRRTVSESDFSVMNGRNICFDFSTEGVKAYD